MSETANELGLTPELWDACVAMKARWDEGVARASEGHCADCGARLRTLTADEQAKADGWHSEPFAVCTACWCVHSRPRPGQQLHPEFLTAISWHSCDLTDPFRLTHDVCGSVSS